MRRVSRYDFTTNAFTHASTVDGRWVGEPIFVPGSANVAEGEGFTLAYVYDGRRDSTGVEIRDAQNVDAEALATLWFDHRMPFDFHENWIGN